MRCSILSSCCYLRCFTLLVYLSNFLYLTESINIFPNSTEPKEKKTPLIYSCPSSTTSSQSPISLPIDLTAHDLSDESNVSLQLKLSNVGQLCTLSRMSKEGHVIPIARSYDGFPWEISAGPYNTLTFDCKNDDGEELCEINIPISLDGDMGEEIFGRRRQKRKRRVSSARTLFDSNFQLTSFSHGISTKDKMARFLEQATFGTTTDELDSILETIDDSSTTDDKTLPAISQWIHNQIYDTTPTLHRQEFRKRTVPQMERASIEGSITQPCEFGARFRRGSFTTKDKKKMLEVVSLEDDTVTEGRLGSTISTTKSAEDSMSSSFTYLLFVDGQLRTMVKSQDFIARTNKTQIAPGTYPICGKAWYKTNEAIGIHYDGKCNMLHNGNPPIDIDLVILESMNRMDLVPEYILYLDNLDIQQHSYESSSGVIEGVTVISENGLREDLCSSIPSMNKIDTLPLIFAQLSNGQYMIHTPHLKWSTNTVQNPKPDGGGETVYSTSGSTFCSNVPKTFLNEDYCTRSTMESTCMSRQETMGSLELNSTNIQQMYEATDRVIYAVSGLRIDSSIKSPCESFAKSRWQKVMGSCSVNVKEQTDELFSNIIQESKDDNLILKDVTLPIGMACHADDMSKKEIIVQVDGQCWKSVHSDEWNVYDFTSWSKSHRGNTDSSNPILAFAQDGSHELIYPSDHAMSRWRGKRTLFPLIGKLGDKIGLDDLPEIFKLDYVKEIFGFFSTESDGVGSVVCGSPGEVANYGQTFIDDGLTFDISLSGSEDNLPLDDMKQQKKTVWTMVALTSSDQLRQRMAWALAQLLVVSPSVGYLFNTEIYLSYYDIFVRGAFGSYKDILREVVYSPLMSEMLSYYRSKSSDYVWEQMKEVQYPDENFAREIQQLFTIGLVELNIDGTLRLDSEGKSIRTYSNDDIMEYARVFTGFDRQKPRGNIEERQDSLNSIDPMMLQSEWRDHLPKMGLNGKYVGDDYILCSDLPTRSFLRRGAKYRLLGKNKKPELQDLPLQNPESISDVKVLELDVSSELLGRLCQQNVHSVCTYPATVLIEDNMSCTGSECDVKTVQVVQVSTDVFYEYIQQPCVNLAFFDNGKQITSLLEDGSRVENGVCANSESSVAAGACVDDSSSYAHHTTCKYTAERLSYSDAILRCEDQGKSLSSLDAVHPYTCTEHCCPYGGATGYFWTAIDCSLAIIIDRVGKVAIERDGKYEDYHSHTFFRVHWSNGDYPSTTNDCGNGTCEVVGKYCRCDIEIKNSKGFGSIPTSRNKILKRLHIGGVSPDTMLYDSKETLDDFTIFYSGTKMMTIDSVFGVEDDIGNTIYLKNMKSNVYILRRNDTELSIFNFRNPPQFYSTIPEARDVQYEVEATLDHFFQHPNTAPFLAKRFIQRFGISNPSPRFVKSVAETFRKGDFTLNHEPELSFGDGRYGNLGATVASILVDRESRQVVLDADPSYGCLREPLIKVISLMRNLQYTQTTNKFVSLYGLESSIGQESYEIPSVFSFFLPEYASPGPISAGSLVAPEAMLIQYNINLLNGMFSLVKYGLNSCYGGFGSNGRCWYESYLEEGVYDKSSLGVPFSKGHLTQNFTNIDNSNDLIDELSTLMTSGRMKNENKQIIKEIYDSEVDKNQALRLAQQLVIASPEFHSTGVSFKSGLEREQKASTSKSCNKYKAVVHILLAGGCDSYNLLVPHSQCTEIAGKDLHEEYKSERGVVALEKDDLHMIDASDQPCAKFGLHPKLPALQSLYQEKDATFFANIGVLNKPVTKYNYEKETANIQLFAHNAMQDEIGKLGEFKKTRILGRLSDVLTSRDFKVDSFAVDASLLALEGTMQNTTKAAVKSIKGFRDFDPAIRSKRIPLSAVRKLNDENLPHSNMFSDTWSSVLHQSLDSTSELYAAQENSNVGESFDDTDVGRGLEFISKMIYSHECRGADRDIFYLEVPNYDHHFNMMPNLESKLSQLNNALESFVNEMKNQGKWEDITVVVSSDFGRTLSPNSGLGTDHGWSGHSFMLGGGLNGGRILGSYPDDLSDGGPLNVGRGRLLPTLPWEAIWNSVSLWVGADYDDLDYILPNRMSFPSSLLFDESELFMMKNESSVNDCVSDELSVSCILENGDDEGDNDKGDHKNNKEEGLDENVEDVGGDVIPDIDSSKTGSRFGMSIIAMIAIGIGAITLIGLVVIYRRRRLHRKVDMYVERMENKSNHGDIMVIETKEYESRDDHTEGPRIM